MDCLLRPGRFVRSVYVANIDQLIWSKSVGRLLLLNFDHVTIVQISRWWCILIWGPVLITSTLCSLLPRNKKLGYDCPFFFLLP